LGLAWARLAPVEGGLDGGVMLAVGGGMDHIKAGVEEDVAPGEDRCTGSSELAGEVVDVLASDEAENCVTLAFGREPAPIADGRAGGSCGCISAGQVYSGAPHEHPAARQGMLMVVRG
jgi:hypothetical protein